MTRPHDLPAFMATLKDPQPPAGWPPGLRVLWHQGKGDWEAAHEIAQDMPGPTGSWLHAYLHRVEGDRWNAGYWYDRAGRPFPKSTLGQEFEELVGFMLHV